MVVGIEAVNAYCGLAQVDVAELLGHRGLDISSSGNHMMVTKTVPLPCEDIVTYAVNAAAPLVNRLSAQDRNSIQTLIVATESAFDLTKAVSTWVHDLLGLSRNCRLLEIKQSSFAGMAAVQLAATIVASSRGARALVVAGDIRQPASGTNAELSQGSGAVAVLVGPQARILILDPGRSGCYSYEITDARRPRADVELIDPDLLVMSYADCLFGAVRNFQRAAPETDFVTSFDLLAMHTPSPGLVVGAHRAVLREMGALPVEQIAADTERRVRPSIRYAQVVGNIQAGATLLAVLSALSHSGIDDEYSLGIFSYGSGCSSEFLGARVLAGARTELEPAALPAHLAGRRRLSMAEYDAVLDRLPLTGFGAEHASLELSEFTGLIDKGPRLLLAGIDGYQRQYDWSDGS